MPLYCLRNSFTRVESYLLENKKTYRTPLCVYFRSQIFHTFTTLSPSLYIFQKSNIPHIYDPVLLSVYISEVSFAQTCAGDTLDLQCPAGSSLVILAANYGRLRRDVCSQELPQSEHDVISCVSNQVPLDVIKEACEGKSQCSLTADLDTLTAGVDPCPGTAKYADVFYGCVGESRERRGK